VIRHEYVVSSDAYRPSGRSVPSPLRVRRPDAADRDALAALMIDAYVGTIDYEGESLGQAVDEVGGYLAGEAMLDLSRVAAADGAALEAALLMSGFGADPIVGYVMTRARSKGQGLASALLDVAAAAAFGAGHAALRAFVTDGNVASETVFKRAGFMVVATFADDR
jgi:GNAT superfamily N-acetyltransferase